MTIPEPSSETPTGTPQPRDIALELGSAEQAAELEAQSDPEPDRPESPS